MKHVKCNSLFRKSHKCFIINAIFYKFGFRIEGKLQSHYRFSEMVYALGKEIIQKRKQQS